ncbi:MAG TPA: UbiA family prenyltransferase, partial [Candidatus Limnocylindria bacterium]|nr:UbiA family prenyltransferase [Candidatus Limnocylindria bacterium]
MIRTGHPFPSLLNALATTAIATLAGAPPVTAGRLGLSMLALQVSIGALNDWADAPRDAVAKQGKPIAAGLVTPQAALGLAAVGLLLGLALSLGSGPAVALVALAGAGLGYAYDFRLSRTIFSWLPLSLALPLLPVHAWLGATGSIPTGLVTVVPVALLAGVVLALSNGLVDLERDHATGKAGIVIRLGEGRAWLAN